MNRLTRSLQPTAAVPSGFDALGKFAAPWFRLSVASRRLRAGDIPVGTRLLETFCFGQSEVFYHDPTYSDGKELAPGLLQYRATYRTNSADWDISERKLEVQLAKVK